MDSRHKGPVTREMFPFDDVVITKYDHNIYIYVYVILKVTGGDHLPFTYVVKLKPFD